MNKSLGTLKRTVIKYDTCCISARSQDDSVSPADIDREFCHARLDARPPPPPRTAESFFSIHYQLLVPLIDTQRRWSVRSRR